MDKKLIVALVILVVIGAGFFVLNKKPKETAVTNIQSEETEEQIHETCNQTVALHKDQNITEAIKLILVASDQHLEKDMGYTASAFEAAKGDEEKSSMLLARYLHDPMGRFLMSFSDIEKCVEIRYVDPANLKPHSAIELKTDQFPEKISISVSNQFKDDTVTTAMLLSDKLAQAVSWYFIEPDKITDVNQCYTNVAHGLALQLSYLMTTISSDETVKEIGAKTDAAAKISQEIDELNIAIVELYSEDHRRDFSLLHEPTREYVRKIPYYKSQCDLSTETN